MKRDRNPVSMLVLGYLAVLFIGVLSMVLGIIQLVR